ncbi:MAG: hypothetical protein K8L99_32955 [Anaerolineae bacterium]|nr:hypothetical protein [Anaerolineae bacterium]
MKHTPYSIQASIFLLALSLGGSSWAIEPRISGSSVLDGKYDDAYATLSESFRYMSGCQEPIQSIKVATTSRQAAKDPTGVVVAQEQWDVTACGKATRVALRLFHLNGRDHYEFSATR